MPKRTLFLLFLFSVAAVLGACRSAPSERFAIYLTAQDSAPLNLAEMELDSLVLQEQPLLTSDDFASYQAGTHEIRLAPSTCQKLQQAFPSSIGVRGVPFVVCVGSERVYAGAFWTPLSSMSYDGVVILQPCMIQQETMRIELGYPSESFFTGRDPRSDPRILSVLGAAGKLE
jgi:hypothetical protein